MSPEPITAERIYGVLRRHIIDGVYLPGTALNLNRLAENFGSSVSPLRDAVHRLVGEHLLQLQPGGGFQLPLMTGDDLLQLYRWHEWLVRMALRKGRMTAAAVEISHVDLGDRSAARIAAAVKLLFDAIGSNSSNADHIRALGNAAARLHAVRLIEPQVMRRTDEEAESLRTLAANGAILALRTAISEYHRRRIRRSARLAALLATTNWQANTDQ